jgi:16S rRNA (uracil1498-N3)-methyltransferase
MTRRRWIADEVSGNHAALIDEHAYHLSRVLRAQVGQEFDIATGTIVRAGVVTAVSDSRVEFDLGEERSSATTKTITLALAVFKFDRMEWAIEKCTELGVARVIPVIAQRTESHLAMAAAKRAERWRRIARESSEQSRRAGAPEICDPMKLKELLGVSAALRIVLSESQPGLALKDALIPAEDVILALGPEGGWTDAESKLFQDRGWTPASLGQTVLRAETAAIAALVIVLSESW